MDNLNKKSKAVAHQLNLDMYLKVVELAKAKGKKPGDDMSEELQEVMRANPDKITPIHTKEDLKQTFKNKKILDLRKKDDADPTNNA